MKFAVVIEKTPRNFSAYLPDVPGCVATGKTRAEARKQITEALAFHLEGLRLVGGRLPKPTSSVEFVIAPRR